MQIIIYFDHFFGEFLLLLFTYLSRFSSCLLSIFFVFIFVYPTCALTISSHYFEPSHVVLGDQFSLVLELDGDSENELVISPFGLPSDSGLEIVNKPVVVLVENGPYRVFFSMQAFNIGDYALPSIHIRQGTQKINTPTYKLKIHSVKNNSDEPDRIRDIKPPILLPIRWWIHVVWSILGLTFGGGIIWFYFYRYRPIRPAETSVVGKLPHEIAYANLDLIENSNWIDAAQFKTYYTQLSQVVRRYLEARYELPFMELPTPSLVVSLKGIGVKKPIWAQIENFLQRADLVKFSELKPNKVEARQLLVDGRKIIGLTRPLSSSIQPTSIDGKSNI